MAKMISDQNQEFDKKLEEISNAYESGKDAVYSMMSPANRYEVDRALDSIRTLRDIACVNLKAVFSANEN